MSTYFFIDSDFRQEGISSNFRILPNQTVNWPSQPKNLNPVSFPLENQIFDFMSKVKVIDFYVYYGNISQKEPFLKLNFENLDARDSFLINNLDNDTDTKFILRFKKDLNNGWVIYKCKMSQYMRLKRNGVFNFQVRDKNNDIFVLNNSRIICTIESKAVSSNIQSRSI